jgi:hypothetical protein
MTRTTTKLETIAAHMLKNLIDIYLIQETWLEGSDDFAIGGITFLMHAQEKQQGRGRGGVAIALSKKALKAWDKAGNTIIKPDLAVDGTVRMMSIDIAVPSNKTWETLSIFNVYAPPSDYDEHQIDHFWESLEQEISKKPTHCQIIVAGDINASIGNRSKFPEVPRLLGPWGSSHTNLSGEKVVDMMTRLNLRAATSYFEHKKYWTWYDHRSGRHHQLDHF